jgi:short-subunit dehydrogenase
VAERAALVTGASSGIGLAIAEMLGSEGYALTVTSRQPDKLATAVEALRAKGFEVHGCPGNVVRDEDIEQVVVEHQAAWGRIDVLVNNAGRGILGPFDQIDPKYIELQLDLNLRAVIMFTRLSLAALRAAVAETGRALVVNVSSIAGKSASPDLAVYSAAKYGVVGFTEALNAELAGEGIHATVLCPEIVDTPLTDIPAFHEKMSADQMIKATDLAEAVRYLLHLSPSCIVPEIVFRNATTLSATR